MLINVALGWVYGRITTRKKEDDEWFKIQFSIYTDFAQLKTD
jgi:hypothetical protein